MQLTEPTWRCNPYGGCIYTAEWFLERTGWLESQITGLEWYRVIAPEDLPRFSLAFFNAIHNQTAFELAYSILDNRNRRIAVHSVSTPNFERKVYAGHSGMLWEV